LRMRAIPERLRGVFTTRRYKNPPLPYLTLPINMPIKSIHQLKQTHAVLILKVFTNSTYHSMKWKIHSNQRMAKICLQHFDTVGWFSQMASSLLQHSPEKTEPIKQNPIKL